MPDVNRKPPDNNHDQSMLFDKEKWTRQESKDWLKDHDYYTDGYDEGETRHRWRQYNTDRSKFKYRNSGRGNGITAIYGIKKE